MENNYFYCEYCNYKSKRKFDLKRHNNAIHIKKTEKNNENENEDNNKIINNENNLNKINKINDNQYIYLLKEREFIKTNEPIYKIGKTKQENLKRFRNYPNGTKLFFNIICNDCDKYEKIIINEFKNNFIHKKEIGNEYFMGNYYKMIDIIYKIIWNEDIKNNINKNENEINNNENNENNFICKKCNKKYKIKKYLINHEEKCNGLNILTCPKCMITFSSYGNKAKHIKKNNCKAISIINKLDISDKDNIIYNFGYERINFITIYYIINIFINNSNNIIPKYIEFKYFNKDFPENNNIKYEKNNKYLIKKNNKWEYINIDNLLNELIYLNSNELNKFYDNNKDDIKDKINNNEFLDYISKNINYLNLSLNKELYNKIKEEIKNIIKYGNIII